MSSAYRHTPDFHTYRAVVASACQSQPSVLSVLLLLLNKVKKINLFQLQFLWKLFRCIGSNKQHKTQKPSLFRVLSIAMTQTALEQWFLPCVFLTLLLLSLPDIILYLDSLFVRTLCPFSVDPVTRTSLSACGQGCSALSGLHLWLISGDRADQQ